MSRNPTTSGTGVPARGTRASALLLVYLLAAVLGLFHGRGATPPSHVCGATAPDLERDDGQGRHDETRCALCHLATIAKLAPTDGTTLTFRADPIGRAAPQRLLAHDPRAPRVQRARAPPSL